MNLSQNLGSQFVALLLVLSSFCLSEPSLAQVDNSRKIQSSAKASRGKSLKPRRPSNMDPSIAGLTEAEAENQLRSEACQQDEILSMPYSLKSDQTVPKDRLIACKSMCSVRGCTYYVFVATSSGRLRQAGLIDGICEALPKADNGFKQIRCVSQSAEQRAETLWRYDGQQYR